MRMMGTRLRGMTMAIMVVRRRWKIMEKMVVR